MRNRSLRVGGVGRSLRVGLESAEPVLDVGPVGDDVDVRDWALDDPDGQSRARVREIRDEVATRVGALFDEIEAELGPD